MAMIDKIALFASWIYVKDLVLNAFRRDSSEDCRKIRR
jgi:hypothetical protein